MGFTVTSFLGPSMIAKVIIKNRLFRHSGVYIISEVAQRGIPFFLLPILTRYLSTADYGIIATFMVYLQIIGILAGLNTNSAVIVNFFQISKENLKIYVANVFNVLAASFLFILLGIFLFKTPLSARLAIPGQWLIWGLVIASARFLIVTNLSLWQAEQRPKIYGFFNIARTATDVTLSLLLVVWIGLRWEGRLYAVITTSVVFGLISIWVLCKRGYYRFEFKSEYTKDALNFGIPLIPHRLAIWILTGIDRIFIVNILGTAATGVYAVGFQIGLVVTIIANGISRAFGPYLFKKLSVNRDRDKEKLVVLTYLIFIGMICLAGMISLISPWVFKIFIGKNFYKASKFVVWIAFGQAFQGMYSMVVDYVSYTKKTKLIGMVTISVGLFHAFLSYNMIKANGPIGAAQATTISFFIKFVSVWILSARIYQMPWLSVIKSGVRVSWKKLKLNKIA